jgi:hypothetical protein
VFDAMPVAFRNHNQLILCWLIVLDAAILGNHLQLLQQESLMHLEKKGLFRKPFLQTAIQVRKHMNQPDWNRCRQNGSGAS